MSERNPEYDRFGPWVIEISEEDPPPPLFVPHLTRSEPALLSVKIPRQIERRRAHPGMDLYDFMVSLYEADMVVLQRVGHEVRTTTLAYRDVQYLRATEELLRGNVRLGLVGDSFDLPYNTVWPEPMRRLVELIRERYVQGHRQAPMGSGPEPDEGGLSFFFSRLLTLEEESGSSMRLLAAQPERTVAPGHAGALQRIFFSVVNKRLLETIHLSDGREIKIIGRGQTYAYRWQTAYGTDTCYIPIAALSDVAWADDAKNATLGLHLRTGGGACSYVFTRDDPTVEPYRAFLASLPPAATGR